MTEGPLTARPLRSRPLFPVNDPLMDTALEHLGEKQFQHQH